jgi:hypothetical protein
MRTIDFTTFGHRSSFARNHFYKNFAPLNFYHLGEVVCYDLNFAVNHKGENVLEHSRTGSRTPTPVPAASIRREEGKICKGGTDAILGVLDRFSTGSRLVLVRGYDRSGCECCVQRGRLGGVFSVQQVLANPWRRTESAGKPS